MATKTKEKSREPMWRRQVLLPDSLYELCTERGQASDVSASAIIRYALRDYFRKLGR